MTRKSIDLADAVHGAAGRARTSQQQGTQSPGGRPPSRQGKRGVLIHLEPEMARRLKHLAVERDTTLQALGVEAFERLLDE